VYLGKKQCSTKSITSYNGFLKSREHEIERISELTEEIVFAHSIDDFEYAIKEHEKIISNVLKTKTIGESSFPGFEGSIKSLGAWGGDFVMMTWKGERVDLEKYLSEKGYYTMFSFDEIVYHHSDMLVGAK
jgi:hypothetical protein